MKHVFLLMGLALTLDGAQAADGSIYRCGNAYTNTVTEEQARTCKLISGANVTVIQAIKPTARAAVPTAQRVDGADQRSKDADARLILEAELRKAEARQAELLKEYNGGEPERQGAEARNNQKYLDRVETLKAAIARNEADVAGIRRELGRLLPTASASAPAGVTNVGR